MLKKIIFAGLLLSFLASCQSGDKTEKKIAEIPIDFNVERFDKDFAQATSEDLPQLKEAYPSLFPERYADSVWVNKMNDSIQEELNREVLKKYSDFIDVKAKLRALFQHLAYYFPGFETPRVVTVTSYVDYEHRILLSDGVLLIALDNYLGKDHDFYLGIQRYRSKNFRKTQIVPDVAKKYAKKHVARPQKRSFLAYMVYYGKILYLKDKLIPFISDADKMGYDEEEIQWAEQNEKQIWSYFIEQDLLYETDPKLREDFFDVGPFTKFGLNLDSESPAQLGQYIGWQVVKQYAAKHDDVSLQKLLKMDNEKLFKESNYKPK